MTASCTVGVLGAADRSTTALAGGSATVKAAAEATGAGVWMGGTGNEAAAQPALMAVVRRSSIACVVGTRGQSLGEGGATGMTAR